MHLGFFCLFKQKSPNKGIWKWGSTGGKQSVNASAKVLVQICSVRIRYWEEATNKLKWNLVFFTFSK